jgi:hypothetical protein
VRRSVKLFAEDPAVKVFLLSLKAGAAGLTLTAANRVVLLEPALDPAVEQQAVARVHRIGQTRPVTITRLIVEDTVEEKVRALCEAKQRLITSAADGHPAAGHSSGARQHAAPHNGGPEGMDVEGSAAAAAADSGAAVVGAAEEGSEEDELEEEDRHKGEGTTLPGLASSERVGRGDLDSLMLDLFGSST